MKNDVPLPERMRHLERDRRGYPIPEIVLRDSDGRPHFTVNDTLRMVHVLRNDLCAICGTKLFRGRWFIGGPRSAFDPHGCYIDAPAHHDCARYALRVCPYLAAPNYGRLIEDRTLADDEPVALRRDERCLPDRPRLFVAVHARGQEVRGGLHDMTIWPTRPYVGIEYWRDGHRLTREEGDAFCRSVGAPRI